MIKPKSSMTRYQFEKACGGEFHPTEDGRGRTNGTISTFTRKSKLPKRATKGDKVFSARTWAELAVALEIS